MSDARCGRLAGAPLEQASPQVHDPARRVDAGRTDRAAGEDRPALPDAVIGVDEVEDVAHVVVARLLDDALRGREDGGPQVLRRARRDRAG